MNGPDPRKALQLAIANARNTPRRDDECEHCTRVGLAILPVRYAVVPDVRGTLPMPAGMGVKEVPLQPGWDASYALRVLRKGYLYVYIEASTGKRWDCYGVTPEGRLRGPYATDQALGQNGAWACARQGHNVKASFITIPDAEKVSAAYFIFSQDPLSDPMRAELAANTTRMQKISVAAWLGGAKQPHAAGVEEIAAGVLEYADNPQGADRAPLQTAWRSRQAEAESMPVAMVRAMQGKYADRAMVLALHDRIGIVQELLNARNVYEYRLTELANTHARALFVASAVENLRIDFDKRGKSAEWAKKYAKAYRAGEVDAFKQRYMAQYKPLEAKRNGYSAAWCAWMQKLPLLLNSLDNRYHPESPMDCVNHSRTIGDMLNGTGALEAEAKLWQSWLTEAGTSKANLVDRALSGGSASFLAFMTSRKDGIPGIVDSFKNLYTAFDEWEKANVELANYKRRVTQGLAMPGIDPREWAVREGEQLLEGLHKTFQTLAGNVQRMGTQMAKHVRNTLVASAFWLDVKFTPIKAIQSAGELALDLKETAWGMEAGKKLELIEASPKLVSYRQNTLEFIDIVAVDNQRLTFVAFEVGYVRNESGLWVPGGSNRTAGGLILPNGTPAPPAAVPPRVNYFLRAKTSMLHAMGGGKGALGFAGVVLLLQSMSLRDALKTLEDEKATDFAKQDARIGLIGAATGASGALLEGSAAAWQIAKGGVVTGGIRLLAGVGGIVGAGATLVQSWQTGVQASDRWGKGDKDSATFLYIAAGAFVVGGIASGAGALAGMGVAVVLGLVGWAVIAIGAIIVGIAMMFGASSTADDPLEAWLKQCLYGIADNRYNEQNERIEFNKIFELPLEVKLEYSAPIIANHEIDITVVLPRLQGRKQKYEVTLVLDTNDGRAEGGSTLSGEINNQETPVRVLAPGQTREQLDALQAEERKLSADRLLYLGDWKVDAGAAQYTITRAVEFTDRPTGASPKPTPYVRAASLEVKFWPDATLNPEISLPVGGGPGGAPARLAVPF